MAFMWATQCANLPKEVPTRNGDTIVSPKTIGSGILANLMLSATKGMQ